LVEAIADQLATVEAESLIDGRLCNDNLHDR
jgi:hypothetical protein